MADSNQSSGRLQEFFTLAIAFILAAGVLWIAGLLDVPNDVGSQFAKVAVTAAVSIVPLAVGMFQTRRKLGDLAAVTAEANGILAQPTTLVVSLLVLVLLVTISTIGNIAARFTYYPGFQDVDDPEYRSFSAGIYLVIFMPVLCMVLFAIGERAAHYLRSRQVQWLSLSVVIWAVVQASIIWLMSDVRPIEDLFFLLSIFGFYAVFIVGIFWLAATVARRRHVAYVVSRLIRRLPADDQRAALLLLRDEALASLGVDRPDSPAKDPR